MILLSFTNLASCTDALASASAQTSGFCSTNAQSPHRPFLEWRTPEASATALWTLDFGSSETVGVIALINANFAGARIRGASSSGFTAPSYAETVAIARNPWNWRHQHVHLTTGFGYRYLQIAVSSQDPVDGSTGFHLGGVWAGARSTTPSRWRWGVTMETYDPVADVGPSHGGWHQRLRLGEPSVRLRAALGAQTCRGGPANADDLDIWQDLLRQARTADNMLVYDQLGDLAQVYVMRSVLPPAWQVGPGLSEGQLELRELIGP